MDSDERMKFLSRLPGFRKRQSSSSYSRSTEVKGIVYIDQLQRKWCEYYYCCLVWFVSTPFMYQFMCVMFVTKQQLDFYRYLFVTDTKSTQLVAEVPVKWKIK